MSDGYVCTGELRWVVRRVPLKVDDSYSVATEVLQQKWVRRDTEWVDEWRDVPVVEER